MGERISSSSKLVLVMYVAKVHGPQRLNLGLFSLGHQQGRGTRATIEMGLGSGAQFRPFLQIKREVRHYRQKIWVLERPPPVTFQLPPWPSRLLSLRQIIHICFEANISSPTHLHRLLWGSNVRKLVKTFFVP